MLAKPSARVLFREQAAAMGTMVPTASIEGHDRIGIVERSHGYLQTVYDKLCIDLSKAGKHERPSWNLAPLMTKLR